MSDPVLAPIPPTAATLADASAPATGAGIGCNTPARVVVPLRATSPAAYSAQAQVCMTCRSRTQGLFGVLDDSALASIRFRIDELTLRAGDTAYLARTSGHTLYAIRSGVVRLERVTESGERRILRLAGRGDVIGMEALLGQTYAADAVACTDVQACVLPRALIDDLTSRHPELTLALMKRWQRALDEADEWLTELTGGSARERMLRLLLKLSEYGEGGQIWLPTRHQMGAMLNLSMETASRMVSTLRREQILLDTDGREARLDTTKLLRALAPASRTASRL